MALARPKSVKDCFKDHPHGVEMANPKWEPGSTLPETITMNVQQYFKEIIRVNGGKKLSPDQQISEHKRLALEHLPKMLKELEAERAAIVKQIPVKAADARKDGLPTMEEFDAMFAEEIASRQVDHAEEAKKQAAIALKEAASAIKGILKNVANNKGQFNTGIGPDDQVYKQIRPHLVNAWIATKAAYGESKQSIQDFIKNIVDAVGAEVQPYARQFYGEILENKVVPLSNGSDIIESDNKEAKSDESQADDRGSELQSRDSERSGSLPGNDNVRDRESVTDGNVRDVETESADNVGSDNTFEDSGKTGVRAAGEVQPSTGQESESGDVLHGRKRGSSTDNDDAAGGSGRKRRQRVKGGDGGTTDGGVVSESSRVSGIGRVNYHISDPTTLIGGTPKVRFNKNKSAIEALLSIQSEGRNPTTEELDSFAAYTGWGSFGQELFNGSFAYTRPKEGWEKESNWLKEHLGKENWESAQASIINAHYTDPITYGVLWDISRQLGFEGGRVLEPSCATGNGFGLMPLDMASRSQLAGIELDRLSGNMAKLLYPEANIQIKGYQESKTADNFYDLVIGNWPFAKDGPSDRRYRHINPSLHDYFFLKALDQVRAGGLIVGITSSGTMDKIGKLTRIEMAKKGELVAAFRLPSGAFKEFAGTSVVTDIIILKKRETPIADVSKEGWVNVGPHKVPHGEINTNEYWLSHPENVLGTMDFGHGTTQGREGMIVIRPDNYLALLQGIAGKLPKGIFNPRQQTERVISYITNNTKDRQNSITVAENGNLFVVKGEYLAPLHEAVKYTPGKAINDEITALVKMRNAYGRLIDAERSGSGTTLLRKELSMQYNAFVKKSGSITDSKALKVFKQVSDPFMSTLAALEVKDGNTYRPAAIMTKSTVRGQASIENPTVQDAYILSRNESMNVDMDKIATLSKTPVADVIKNLVGNGAVYLTPAGTYEVSDQYLSGNVRRKLREAEAAQETGMDMGSNIEALKKIVPPDQPYFKIEAKLGAPWVGAEHYERFIADLLGEPDSNQIEVNFHLGAWKVTFTNDRLNYKPEAQTIWGIPVRSRGVKFSGLVKAAMNNSAVVVWGVDENGDKVLDEKETAKANEQAAKIREEFSSWIWKDSSRKVTLEKEYNEIMNAVADTKFDGSFLSFAGMALLKGDNPFNLRKHQVDAIWRGLLNKGGLYAHEVGTGKTFTIAGLAVESRRYGIAKKPLLFAHNANSKTVYAEAQQMYPGAKILYVNNLAPDQIETTMRQIANDEWDLIVVPHSAISRFGLKRETLDALAAAEIDAMEQEALEAAQEDGVNLTIEMMNDEDAMKKVRSVTAKQLVHARNRIIKKIEDMAQQASKENAISFEELGVDMVIVDEAHEFKKPPITTKMKLKGLNTATSGQSLSLHMLTGYIKSINAGKGVHLFTGTPITNTMTEIYHMMRYMMDNEMDQAGIKAWDSWFNTFADSISDVELTAAGDYEAVTRLASFVNVPELRKMMGQYTDIVFADDMPVFVPRTTESGKTLQSADLTKKERDWLTEGRSENDPIGRPYKKIITEVSEMGATQKAKLAELKALAQLFRKSTKKERRQMMLEGHPANPVLVETAAANAGMDIRLVDMEAEDNPNSKVNKAVTNMLDIYKNQKHSSQVVFMERGFSDKSVSNRSDGQGGKTKTKTARFNLAKDIVDKLIAGGVPRSEIAIVDGGVSKDAREKIAKAMNSGAVRVVIGNTKTLGVGVNMQENLRAIHHLDAPWMPGELEQRNGRGWRQDNKWNTVLEIRYVTEGLDGRRWQVLVVKDRFIKAFLKADDSVRTIEGDALDESEAGDLAATLAEAAGDPRILLREKYKKDVEKLQNRERTHAFGIMDAEKSADNFEREIAGSKAWADLIGRISAYHESNKDTFTFSVGSKKYDTRDDAQKAFDAALTKAGTLNDFTKFAEIQGFGIEIRWSNLNESYDVRMTVPDGLDTNTGVEQKYVKGSLNSLLTAKPSIRSMEAVLRNLPKHQAEIEKNVTERKASIENLRKSAYEPFPRQAELNKKIERLSSLMADLAANPVPPPSWLRHGAPVGGEVTYKGKTFPVIGHKWDDTGYYVTLEKSGSAENAPYMEVQDDNGFPVYEEHNFEAPVVAAAQSTQANPVTLDSMGLQQIYEKLAAAKWPKEVMGDVQKLGSHVYATGKQTFKEWFAGMKAALGKLFVKYGTVLEKVWKDVSRIMKDETGVLDAAFETKETEKGIALYSKGNAPSATTKEMQSIEKVITGKSMIQVAQHIAANAPNESYKLIASKVVAKLLKMRAVGFKLSFNILRDGDDLTVMGGGNGVTTAKGNDVEVFVGGADTQLPGVAYETLLHELVHAVTAASMIDNRVSGTALHSEYRQIMQAVGQHLESKANAGELTDFEARVWRQQDYFAKEGEMIAWAFTNPEMQAMLESTPYKQNMSLWDKFVNAVRDMLGIDKNNWTALSEIMRVGKEYIDDSPNYYRSDTAGNTGLDNRRNGNIPDTPDNSRGDRGDRPGRMQSETDGSIRAGGRGFRTDQLSSERRSDIVSRQHLTTPELPKETKYQALKRVGQDKYNRLGILEKHVQEQGVQLSNMAKAHLYLETMEGRIADKLERFLKNEIAPLLKDMAKAKISMVEVESFALTQHAAEANAAVQKLHNDPSLTAFGMSDQAAIDMMDEYRARPDYTVLKGLAERFQKFTDGTKKLRNQNGLLHDDTVAAWDATYKHYIPLRGGEKNQTMGTGKGLKIFQKDKRRFGHELRDEAIFENIIKMRENAIRAVEKNVVVLSVIKFLQEANDDSIGTIGKPEKHAHVKDMTVYAVYKDQGFEAAFPTMAEAERFMERDARVSKTDIKKYAISQTKDAAVVWAASPMPAPNELIGYVAGHQVRVQINDDILAPALTNMGVDSLGRLLSGSKAVMNYMSKAYTAWDPRFTYKNTVRDFRAGLVNMTGDYGIQMAGKMAAAYPAAMRDLFKGRNDPAANQWVDRYRKAGGSTGASFVGSLDRIGGDIQSMYTEHLSAMGSYSSIYHAEKAKGRSDMAARTLAATKSGLSKASKYSGLSKMLDAMELINKLSENAFRLAVFKTLIKEGKSDIEAAAAAKGSTINFDKKGEASATIGAMWLFFNPAVQGAERSVYALFESEHKTQAKLLWGAQVMLGVAMGTLAASIMVGDSGDDDEWAKIPRHIKNRNLIIPTGPKSYKKLPESYEFGSATGLGYFISDAMRGKANMKSAIALTASFAEGFSPFGNPIVEDGLSWKSAYMVLPTFAKLAVSGVSNLNSLGQQIAPKKYQENKPDSQNMNRNTKGTVYDWLAQRLNEASGGDKYSKGAVDVSPEMLKYWTKTLVPGGVFFVNEVIGAANIMARGGTLEQKEKPMLNLMAGENGIKETRAAFYEIAKEVEQATAEWKAARKDRNFDVADAKKEKNGDLIRLSRFIAAQKKMITRQRNAVDAIRADDSLSFTEKRDRTKEIEDKEEQIYNKTINKFKDK